MYWLFTCFCFVHTQKIHINKLERLRNFLRNEKNTATAVTYFLKSKPNFEKIEACTQIIRNRFIETSSEELEAFDLHYQGLFKKYLQIQFRSKLLFQALSKNKKFKNNPTAVSLWPYYKNFQEVLRQLLSASESLLQLSIKIKRKNIRTKRKDIKKRLRKIILALDLLFNKIFTNYEFPKTVNEILNRIDKVSL